MPLILECQSCHKMFTHFREKPGPEKKYCDSCLRKKDSEQKRRRKRNNKNEDGLGTVLKAWFMPAICNDFYGKSDYCVMCGAPLNKGKWEEYINHAKAEILKLIKEKLPRVYFSSNNYYKEALKNLGIE